MHLVHAYVSNPRNQCRIHDLQLHESGGQLAHQMGQGAVQRDLLLHPRVSDDPAPWSWEYQLSLIHI